MSVISLIIKVIEDFMNLTWIRGGFDRYVVDRFAFFIHTTSKIEGYVKIFCTFATVMIIPGFVVSGFIFQLFCIQSANNDSGYLCSVPKES